MWSEQCSEPQLVGQSDRCCRTMVALHFGSVQYARRLSNRPCSTTGYSSFSLVVRQHALCLLVGWVLSELQQAGGQAAAVSSGVMYWLTKGASQWLLCETVWAGAMAGGYLAAKVCPELCWDV